MPSFASQSSSEALMALALDPTESSDTVDAEYSSWRLDTVALEIRVHLDVIDAIKRDILENPGHATGVLLGRGTPGGLPVLWIERYRRAEEGSPLAEHEDEPAFDAVGVYAADDNLPPEA